MPGPDPASPFVSRAGLKLAHALDEFGIDVTGLICADFGCNIGGFTDCLLQRGAKLVYAIDTGYGTLAWKLRSDSRVIVMERTNALHAPPPAEEKRGREPFSEKGSRPLFCDLVVIDLGWTPQRLAVPAALRWLRPERGPVAQASRLCEGPAALRRPEHSAETRTGETPVPPPEPRETPMQPPAPGETPVPPPEPGETPVPPTEPGQAAPSGRIITLIKPHYELEPDEKRTLLRGGALEPADAERIVQRVLASMPTFGVDVIAHTRSPLHGRKSSRARGADADPGNIEFLALLRPRAASPADR